MSTSIFYGFPCFPLAPDGSESLPFFQAGINVRAARTVAFLGNISKVLARAGEAIYYH